MRRRRRASGTLTLTRPGLAGVAPRCGLPGAAGSGRLRGGRGRAGGGDGQQRLGAHRQDGVAAEGVPGPDLVLVQARLSLTLLVAFFGLRLLRGWRQGFLIRRSRFRRCLAHVVARGPEARCGGTFGPVKEEPAE